MVGAVPPEAGHGMQRLQQQEAGLQVCIAVDVHDGGPRQGAKAEQVSQAGHVGLSGQQRSLHHQEAAHATTAVTLPLSGQQRYMRAGAGGGSACSSSRFPRILIAGGTVTHGCSIVQHGGTVSHGSSTVQHGGTVSRSCSIAQPAAMVSCFV